MDVLFVGAGPRRPVGRHRARAARPRGRPAERGGPGEGRVAGRAQPLGRGRGPARSGPCSRTPPTPTSSPLPRHEGGRLPPDRAARDPVPRRPPDDGQPRLLRRLDLRDRALAGGAAEELGVTVLTGAAALLTRGGSVVGVRTTPSGSTGRGHPAGSGPRHRRDRAGDRALRGHPGHAGPGLAAVAGDRLRQPPDLRPRREGAVADQDPARPRGAHDGFPLPRDTFGGASSTRSSRTWWRSGSSPGSTTRGWPSTCTTPSSA